MSQSTKFGGKGEGYQRKPNRHQVGAAEPCNCDPAWQARSESLFKDL